MSHPGNVEIYTSDGVHKYTQYLHVHTYPQNAISFNSDNMWFPVTRDMQLHVRYNGGGQDVWNVGVSVYIVGYRISA